MKRYLCVAVIAALIPLSAGAEMIRLSRCTVNPGKTLTAVQTVFEKWRELLEKEGFGDHGIRLLVPHAGSETAGDTFWIEFSSPDFTRYGMVWEWWYTDPDAAAAAASMEEVFGCETAGLFRSVLTMRAGHADPSGD